PGDWLRVYTTDASGNAGTAGVVRVPGTDTSAPSAIVGLYVQGWYQGYANQCLVSGRGEPSSSIPIFNASAQQTLLTAQRLSASGDFSIPVSSCRSGDVLVAYVSDGLQDGARATAAATGTDTTAPSAPSHVTVSASVGGKVTVTASTEPGATLVVTNT